LKVFFKIFGLAESKASKWCDFVLQDYPGSKKDITSGAFSCEKQVSGFSTLPAI
jgi:hypothetical protein